MCRPLRRPKMHVRSVRSRPGHTVMHMEPQPDVRKDGSPTLQRRGYSWPPLEPGHTITLQHGAYSTRTWKPLADELAEHLATVAPWTAGSAFSASVASWARTEAQILLVMAWLDEHGPLDGEGEPRKAATLLAALEQRVESQRAKLGLDPLSLSKLLTALGSIDGSAVAGGLDALKAAGAELAARATERVALASGVPAVEQAEHEADDEKGER